MAPAVAADFLDRGLGADFESAELQGLAIADASTTLAAADGRCVARVRGGRTALALGFVALAAVGLAIGFAPETTAVFARRAFLLAGVRYPRRSRVEVRVPEGGLRVVEGQDVLVELLASGEPIADAALLVRESGSAGDFTSYAGEQIGPGRFAVRLRAVDRALDLVAVGGDDRDLTPVVPLILRVPPSVRSVSVRVTPPDYTHAAPHASSGGEVVALRGSRVELRVTPSVAAVTGEVRFSWGETAALEASQELSGENDPGSVRVTFRAEKSGRYVISLRDARGLVGRETPPYSIVVAADRAPECTLEPPGFGGDVTARANVSVRGRGRDDVGLAAAAIVVRAQVGEKRIEAPIDAGAREARIERVLSIADFGVFHAGDRLPIAIEVSDARPDGPQTARSSEFTLRIVTETAMLRQILDQILGVKQRLARPLDASGLAREALELSAVGRAIVENRVGGDDLAHSIGVAAGAVEEAARARDDATRADAIARARAALAGIGDLAELALLARVIAADQDAAAEEIAAVRDAALSGALLGDRAHESERRERTLAGRVHALGSAFDRERLRYEEGRAPRPLEKAREYLVETAPERTLGDCARLLADTSLVGAAERAAEAARALEAIARLLESTHEGPPPVARDRDDGSKGTSVTDELKKLIDQLEHRAEEDAKAGAAPEADELRKELDDLTKMLDQAKDATKRDEASRSENPAADRAAQEAADRAKQKLQEAKDKVGRGSVGERIELRRDGLEATRQAIQRMLDREANRQPGVVERDISQDALGQNLTGEYSAEKVKAGTASGLLPEETAAHRAGVTRVWGDLPPRSPDEILKAADSGGARSYEEALRTYYRALALPH
ncbi:MAG: hypothetical protein HYR85_12450 [Planctomycetes bacterium]|nr:hypothetical protein [Planctomycetota bacterium]